MNIAVYVYEQAEELDWAGPWEVFAAWALGWPDDGVRAFTVGDSREPVRCAKGLRILTDHTWDDTPSIDVLLVPGGEEDVPAADETLHTRLRALHGAGAVVTSVCTGAFVLQAAGLLDGLPATTHWGSLDRLRELGVDARDERFVDTGAIVTAAGVSAGIDMALHLVARLHSAERAREVRRYIQYDPEPPV